MDFALTAEEQAFAADIRSFLRDHPPARYPLDGMDAGYGSGAHSRAFLAALAAQGWISMCWPEGHGGRAPADVLQARPAGGTGARGGAVRPSRGVLADGGRHRWRGMRPRPASPRALAIPSLVFPAPRVHPESTDGCWRTGTASPATRPPHIGDPW